MNRLRNINALSSGIPPKEQDDAVLIDFIDAYLEIYKTKQKRSIPKEIIWIISQYIPVLSPPMLRACTFTKQYEDNKYSYFDKQCKGIIKYDRDLLQYFCITEHTESELASELIDIIDRLAIIEKQEVSMQQFGKKYFCQNLNKIQISKVKSGLRKYHHRFLPVLPRCALKQIADKISGYQKYCILLSLIIDEITKLISNRLNKTETIIPFMIDMMILPPGCFNKIKDEYTKSYDSSGPMKIGDIKKRLKDFNIPINETRGLNDKPNNFDVATTQSIIKRILEYINHLTNNLTKKNQRICILIDRRWRINCKRFDAFNKLKQYTGDNNGGNKNNNNNNDDLLKHDFYNNKHDTIYVYQPNLGKNKKSYHEFNDDYCHETLIYLTKNCIIPRKDHHMHIGGDSFDGWFFNISAHIKKPKPLLSLWYKYEQKWYIFLQSAALRFFPQDMSDLWPKYFVDSDQDIDKLTSDEIKKLFGINLQETDAIYQRWYDVVKRLD